MMIRSLLAATCLAGFCAGLNAAPALADPMATLDRNGAWVSVEAYGPNVTPVTFSDAKAQVLKGPGFGIWPANADNRGFTHTGGDGDTFTPGALTLHVNAAPPPHVPS